MKQELIFVYNANSDFFSTVTDFAHKILSPATYQCHLCALTFGNFSIKQGWKSFIEGLSLKAILLHKDEFEGEYGIYPHCRLSSFHQTKQSDSYYQSRK
jgi:hypothetical protein